VFKAEAGIQSGVRVSGRYQVERSTIRTVTFAFRLFLFESLRALHILHHRGQDISQIVAQYRIAQLTRERRQTPCEVFPRSFDAFGIGSYEFG
jgi:hypothetical protein